MLNNKNIYTNLLHQFNKVFNHNRQGSFRTKHRYAEAFRRFLAFLAEVFRLEKIANIAPKHLHAYVDYLVQKGRTMAYIKTELSAIRFYHDQIPGAKHRLPDNKALHLAKRQYGGVDRTWSSAEFNRIVAKASLLGREDYIPILCLARDAGLRLHKCFRLDTQTATLALKSGVLTVKGKGGLIREVPINRSIEIQLRKMLEITPRGHKLFVKPEDKTHLAMQRLEEFIRYHKPEVQDADSTRPFHFHGLRHTYAVEQHLGFLEQGMTEKEARLATSKLLGHNRDDVTKIYLAALGGEAWRIDY